MKKSAATHPKPFRPLSRRDLLAAGAVSAFLQGCGAPGMLPTPDPEDAGLTAGEDGGWADSGAPDAGLTDGGVDGGVDGGTPDAGHPDAGVDGGAPDSGTADAGASDAGVDGGVTPQCLETEDNVLGPFYRANAPFRTVLASPADGEWLIIEGTVVGAGFRDGGGERCAPLPGALVDVWQANAQASYDLTNPSFLWRGRMNADAKGTYSFQTILPGRYLNGGVFRPRHIHLKASQAAHVALTTQLYFQGDPYLAADPFVRPSLVIPLTKVNGVWRGTFPIVLRRL